MTKIFLETLRSFYYEYESSASKKYGGSFSKKKEGETNAVSAGRQRRPHVRKNSQTRQHQHQVSSVIPVFTNNLTNQSVPIQQQHQQQSQQHTNYNNNHHHQNFERKKVSFDPIPMKYAELYPSLVVKNLIQPRNPPQIPEPLPWWFKPDLHCSFHKGAPGHDIENCYPLKVFDVFRIRRSLVEIHRDLCLSRYMGSDVNVIVLVFKTPERVVIQFDSSSKKENRSVSLLVIRLAGHVPYSSDKVVPYKYNATMIENGQEVPLSVANLVVNILDVVKVTRSGRMFSQVFPKVMEEVSAGKKVDVPAADLISALTFQSSESSKLKANDDDEGSFVEGIGTSLHGTRCTNNNLAVHISMNCKEDDLPNVLVDTCSSLNMLPKSSLARLSYQGSPMRLWIPEAGVVTSTLHQKLKFVKNGKLVVVGGEKALLVSHLLSFTYVYAEEEVGTPFQALFFVDELKKTRAPVSSLKDAKEVVQTGNTDKGGRVVEVIENKNKAGMGF
ncbi:hypothetical protein KIW84_055377 [Lathyrus oleraceus]|uniref:Uncharacterized protein n=1 Tax=Pisum sativum TaxID=3888 RepID=A0A9D5ALB1_PEA|nr:hypothetical protein KIW84_055377 [Pisum sativum]